MGGGDDKGESEPSGNAVSSLDPVAEGDGEGDTEADGEGEALGVADADAEVLAAGLTTQCHSVSPEYQH